MKRSRQACELCKGEAAVYCEADSAHLCWSCDAVVHGANFLVARHVRRRLLLTSRCSAAAALISGPGSCDPDRADPPASPPSSSSCVSSSESTAAASTAKRQSRRRSDAARLRRRREGMPARVRLAGEVLSAVKGGRTCESALRRREARLARPAEEGWAEC